jgi:hypothetical protein
LTRSWRRWTRASGRWAKSWRRWTEVPNEHHHIRTPATSCRTAR